MITISISQPRKLRLREKQLLSVIGASEGQTLNSRFWILCYSSFSTYQTGPQRADGSRKEEGILWGPRAPKANLQRERPLRRLLLSFLLSFPLHATLIKLGQEM